MILLNALHAPKVITVLMLLHSPFPALLVNMEEQTDLNMNQIAPRALIADRVLTTQRLLMKMDFSAHQATIALLVLNILLRIHAKPVLSLTISASPVNPNAKLALKGSHATKAATPTRCPWLNAKKDTIVPRELNTLISTLAQREHTQVQPITTKQINVSYVQLGVTAQKDQLSQSTTARKVTTVLKDPQL